MPSNKKYIFIAIVGLVTAFTMQVLWLVSSLLYTAHQIKSETNTKLENALFKEAEIRACYYGKNIPVSPMNSNQPSITYFETELNRRTNSNISLTELKFLLHKCFDSKYTIVMTNKKVTKTYKGIHNTIFTVNSDKIYLNTDKTKTIQIIVNYPYSLFFEKLGLIIFASFLMLLITIFCIFQQVKIIRNLQEHENIIKEFTYAMIHDMKTPLATIRLGISALENNKIINDTVKRSKYLQIISTENLHAYNLINKILTIAKSEAKKLEINKSEISLDTLLTKIEENFKANRQKHIYFEHHITYPFVYADEEYLKEIFYNLIDNSIKYSEGDVTIKISSEKVDKGVTIRVKDNGIGISQSDQKVIFDKYERASASKRTLKKSGAPGFGLGLTYVFQVIDAHHGMVSVDSKINKYTEFTIFLPYQNENDTD